MPAARHIRLKPVCSAAIIYATRERKLNIITVKKAGEYMAASDSERLKKIREKKEQLARQEREILAREKEKARKLDTRRKIVVGGIFLKYFPEFQSLEPKRTNEENEAEYAPLANFLSRLAKDKNLVDYFKNPDA
jgi:hypothetical protein